MTSRALAAKLVGRILDEGAFSNVVIRTATADLEPRDGRFVQKLVYEAIRHLIEIDVMLTKASSRPLDRLEPAVRDALRIGVTELRFLDTPPYAAIDAAVESVRSRAGNRATGFTNAVLRSLARDDIDREQLPALPDAAVLGVPDWMLVRLSQTFGERNAIAFFESSNRDAPAGLRVRPGQTAPGTPVPGIPGAFASDDPGAVAEAVTAGSVVVQDPASVAVALAVEPSPGQTVADLAAAPGGKTLHLWEEMGERGLLVATDRHPRRLRTTKTRLPGDIETLVADAGRPPFRPRTFDRVLLDAPCTGLGTLRRRPEIRHRIAPDAPAAAGTEQRRLLDAALRLVRPGGRLVYSVCTLFEEETVDVVENLGGRPPSGLPGETFGCGLLLAPHLTATDGMFISVFDR